jgi:UDP-N-acetyl-D-mannosaminuronic acid dehydrogenase
MEKGAKKALNKCLKKNNLLTSKSIGSIIYSKYIVVCIGTPIDNNLKPKLRDFIKFFKNLKKYLHKDHVIIIRSSIYPGIVTKVEKILKSKNNNIVYCPERIVQGKSLEELPKLPQIVASNNKKTINKVKKLFKKITSKIILTNVLEAELIKLFSNANRYINFSIANQFYLMCKSMNLDYSRIRGIMQDGYARNLNLSKAGFTAGPCLLKDTMQLSSFFKKKFNLGHAAMQVNESMPNYIVDELKKIKNIKKKTIGLLGLAFKADNDDIRDSLSIKLLSILKRKKFKVIQSDEYYKNKDNIIKKTLIKKSSIIIIGAPHKQYKNLKIPKNKTIIDIWNIIK